MQSLLLFFVGHSSFIYSLHFFRLWLTGPDDQRLGLPWWKDHWSWSCSWHCNSPLPRASEGVKIFTNIFSFHCLSFLRFLLLHCFPPQGRELLKFGTLKSWIAYLKKKSTVFVRVACWIILLVLRGINFIQFLFVH